MRGLIAWALAMCMLAILVTSPHTVYGSVSAQTQQRTALFGQVAEILPMGTDLVTILLDTPEGARLLSVTRNTVLRMPGREPPSLAKLLKGDSLAAIAQESDGELKVLELVVKPTRPVTARHLVGVVVALEGQQLVFVDRDGNYLELTLGLGVTGLAAGDTVTLIVRHDLQTDEMIVFNFETADDAVARLRTALENAGKEGDRARTDVFNQRLTAAVTGHLTVLQETLARTARQAAEGIQQALASSRSGYEQLLQRFDLGSPQIEVEGIVTLVDTSEGSLTVRPAVGKPLDLFLNDTTQISFRGEPLQFNERNLGNRVVALYDAATRQVLTIEMKAPEVSQQALSALLARAAQGEVEGRVSAVETGVTPPVVTITTTDGELLILKVPSQAVIRVSDRKVSLSQLQVNSQAKVHFDPSTREVIELSTFDVRPGEEFLTGVVKSVIRKLQTLTIVTPQGTTVELTLPAGTVITRNGRIVPIAEVRLGDLVRPTTRYDPDTGRLLWLALKERGHLPVEGAIRGKLSVQGKQLLTISTKGMETLTLNVTTVTKLLRLGQTVTFDDVQIRERVTAGEYDPITLDALTLQLSAPRDPQR